VFRRSQGFTLLELLIVLVILGITLSFAVLSFGLKDSQSELKQQGTQLAALMQLASEESILLGQEIALQFNDEGYYFLNLKDDKWLEIKDDQVFRKRNIPTNIQVNLSVEGISISNENALEERIYFFSSGESSPFELTLSAQDTTFRYKVVGDSQAAIKHGNEQF